MPPGANIDESLIAAISAYKAKRYADAEAQVDALLARTPRHAPALQLKALLAQLRRDPATAYAAAAVSLAIRPGHAATLGIARDIAISLVAAAGRAGAEGATAEAVRNLRRALELDPAHARVWFSLGLALQDAGDYPVAAEAFAHVLALTPQDATAMVNRGVSLQQAGDLDAAWNCYCSAYRTDPSTFAAISQALPAGSVGILVLDLEALRERLGA